MRRGVLLAAVAAASVPVAIPGRAASVELRPGLWELTGTIDRDGDVSVRKPRFRCVSPEMARAAAADAELDLGAAARAILQDRFGRDACRLVRETNSDRALAWRLRCTGTPSAEQEGTVRFESPRRYTVTIRTRMTAADRTVASTVTTEGRHRGECPR